MFPERDFIDSQHVTKYGVFNLRVYADCHQKETLVLFTKNLDTSKPILVRVHSECITGDMLKSMHCDCGYQFETSLKTIHNEGGVLIYLRQEGRGIGLFEKIKAHLLQQQGYDTFEANVVLGHLPDARNYDMVKRVLNDLQIKKIKLLTNNPSKVSEIAKLGFFVIERMPLATEVNQYNEFYLETKKKKFQHFLETKTSPYYYQFQVNSSDQFFEIQKFLQNKKNDPLLKIGVGIPAAYSTFQKKEELKRIGRLFNSIEHTACVPVLHYSFKDSKDLMTEIHEIREKMPFVHCLQLNDLPEFEISFYKKVHKFFDIRIPLSEENFDLIGNNEFTSFVKENNIFLLLDNSKGRGIEEPIHSLKNKIGQLLHHGLNNIILCGGFGPDNLNVFFELRRYYKINFSIDAETKLKQGENFNTEKIKLYLSQLLTS